MDKKRPSSVQRTSCLSPSILAYNSKKNIFSLSPKSKKFSDERKNVVDQMKGYLYLLDNSKIFRTQEVITSMILSRVQCLKQTLDRVPPPIR